MSELTGKQQRFVDEYLIDLNGAAAAIRAGYSKKAARQTAHENLTKTYIQEAIQKAKATRQERTQITADIVILGLRDEAEFKGMGSVHSARVSAWKALGDHLGLFGAKGTKDSPIHHEHVTADDARRKLYDALVAGSPTLSTNGADHSRRA